MLMQAGERSQAGELGEGEAVVRRPAGPLSCRLLHRQRLRSSADSGSLGSSAGCILGKSARSIIGVSEAPSDENASVRPHCRSLEE